MISDTSFTQTILDSIFGKRRSPNTIFDLTHNAETETTFPKTNFRICNFTYTSYINLVAP